MSRTKAPSHLAEQGSRTSRCRQWPGHCSDPARHSEKIGPSWRSLKWPAGTPMVDWQIAWLKRKYPSTRSPKFTWYPTRSMLLSCRNSSRENQGVLQPEGMINSIDSYCNNYSKMSIILPWITQWQVMNALRWINLDVATMWYNTSFVWSCYGGGYHYRPAVKKMTKK